MGPTAEPTATSATITASPKTTTTATTATTTASSKTTTRSSTSVATVTSTPTSASATSTMTPSTSTSSTESDLWPLVCGPPCRCTYWQRSGRLHFNTIEQCQERAEARGHVFFTFNSASRKCATSNTCFYNT